MTSSAIAATSAALPIGTIVASILRSDSLPAGWLPCDGSAIPARCQELMTLLNSTRTPNLIGRTLVGAGNLNAASTSQTDGLYPAFAEWTFVTGETLQIGATGGESLHSLFVYSFVPHSHEVKREGAGLRSISRSTESERDQPMMINPSATGRSTANGDGNLDHHRNVPPYYAVTYIIFAGT